MPRMCGGQCQTSDLEPRRRQLDHARSILSERKQQTSNNPSQVLAEPVGPRYPTRPPTHPSTHPPTHPCTYIHHTYIHTYIHTQTGSLTLQGQCLWPALSVAVCAVCGWTHSIRLAGLRVATCRAWLRACRFFAPGSSARSGGDTPCRLISFHGRWAGADLRSQDVLWDLGCGDGVVLIEAPTRQHLCVEVTAQGIGSFTPVCESCEDTAGVLIY